MTFESFSFKAFAVTMISAFLTISAKKKPLLGKNYGLAREEIFEMLLFHALVKQPDSPVSRLLFFNFS